MLYIHFLKSNFQPVAYYALHVWKKFQIGNNSYRKKQPNKTFLTLTAEIRMRRKLDGENSPLLKEALILCESSQAPLQLQPSPPRHMPVVPSPACTSAQ